MVNSGRLNSTRCLPIVVAVAQMSHYALSAESVTKVPTSMLFVAGTKVKQLFYYLSSSLLFFLLVCWKNSNASKKI